MAYVQRNVRHDELIPLLRTYFTELKTSSYPNSETLFGPNSFLPSSLPSRFSLVREKTAEGSGGFVFKTEEGHAWAFSPVDSLFSIADLLCSPSAYPLGWLLLLQLPIVKIYNLAAYERIVRRIYAMLAADTALHTAALNSHIVSECTFAPHNFAALRAFLTHNLESYYPFFTAIKGKKFVVRAAAEYIKECWSRRERFKPGTCKDPNFSELISSQLFCVVPSAYTVDLSLSAELNNQFYVNESTGVITLSLDNPEPKSLELLTTWATRSNSSYTLSYDTSVSDLLYDSLSVEELRKRYTVVSQLVDYAVKTSLQRDVYFAAHLRYSLSGLLYIGSTASVKASKALYNSVLGWADKPNNFPFAASLRPTVLSDFHKDKSGAYTSDAAGYYYPFDSEDEYNSVMHRWLLVTDITALVSYDYLVVLPSLDLDRFFNRKVPSITYLEYKVLPKFSSGTLGPIPQPFFTAPMTKRTTPVYSVAYVASLATAIGQYLQIIESVCFHSGEYTQGQLTHGMPVFMSRCLCAQLLSEVGISATTFFHDTPEGTNVRLLMNIPRFLKYLAHDGHIVPLAPGFNKIMQNRSLHTGPVTPKQFYSWYPQGATDQLALYKVRLRMIDAVVIDQVYQTAEYKHTTHLPPTTPTAVTTVFTREERNDVWNLGSYDVSDWGICWLVPKVYALCRREFSSRVDGKKLTFPLRDSSSESSPKAATPVLRSSRARTSYQVADVSEALPGGYTLHARVLRKGFQTFISLPWSDLFARYRVRPPHFTAVYRHKLSERKKRELMDPRTRKEQQWGLYIDFFQRATYPNAPSLQDLVKDWGIPLAEEQSRLVQGVRVFQDIGYAFDIDFLLGIQSNSWDGGVSLCDKLPSMRQLIENWRVMSFSGIRYEQRKQARKDYNSSRRTTDRVRNPFTPEEDLVLVNYYRKDMTERAEDYVRTVCANHGWPAIIARANKLAIKLVRDEHVTEINKLPVVRVGKSLRKLIDEVEAKQLRGELPY